MKCVTIHLSLHNEVLERGELSPAGTGQHGHGHHSGDQGGRWQHKNMLSRSSTYLHAIKCIYYLPINFRTENQDVMFLLVLCSCSAPPAMFQTEAGQILSDRLCVQLPNLQSPVDSHPQSSWL